MSITTETPEKVYRVHDVARHLNVNDGTVYRMIREGHLRSIRVGRLLRVSESELAGFIRGR